MSLTAYPQRVSVDATALVVFSGPPNVAVEWSLDGAGSLAPQSFSTDARGVAGAVYTPVTAGDVATITVTHGT